jgi:hypothetical protein
VWSRFVSSEGRRRAQDLHAATRGAGEHAAPVGDRSDVQA